MGTLERNAQAYRAATELLELLEDAAREVAGHPHFWETLAKLAAARSGLVIGPRPVAAAPMDDAEAARFERQAVPYGAYQGTLVRDVPPRYWLAFESRFNRELRRYLASRRFQDLQVEELDSE